VIFARSLQVNACILLWPPPLPATSFPIHYSLIILSFDAIQSDVLIDFDVVRNKVKLILPCVDLLKSHRLGTA
jgi:hypothetical protein